MIKHCLHTPWPSFPTFKRQHVCLACMNNRFQGQGASNMMCSTRLTRARSFRKASMTGSLGCLSRPRVSDPSNFHGTGCRKDGNESNAADKTRPLRFDRRKSGACFIIHLVSRGTRHYGDYTAIPEREPLGLAVRTRSCWGPSHSPIPPPVSPPAPVPFVPSDSLRRTTSCQF